MRTTLTIDDSLLAQARKRAAERGATVSDIVDEALRRDFARPTKRPVPPAIQIFTKGKGPVPGVDLSSNTATSDLLDDGIPLDKQR